MTRDRLIKGLPPLFITVKFSAKNQAAITHTALALCLKKELVTIQNILGARAGVVHCII